MYTFYFYFFLRIRGYELRLLDPAFLEAHERVIQYENKELSWENKREHKE